MENPKNEVVAIYETFGNFSFKLEKYFHMPYQFVIFILCIIFYSLGLFIAILVDNYSDFVSSWAVVIGSIGLYVSLTTLIWAEREFFTIITERIRYSFDVNNIEYFQNFKQLLLEIYDFKKASFWGAFYFLLAMSVVIPFLQGTKDHFLPGFNSNLISSRIFMAYVVLWAGIISFLAGMIVHYVLLTFKFNPIVKNFGIVFNLSHPDGMFGFKPLSNFLLKIIVVYYFVTLLFIIWLITDFSFGCYLLVGSISLLGIGIYFFPQVGIHQAINKTKSEILKEINLTIDTAVLKDNISNEVKFDKLKNMIIINDKILKTNSWLLNWNIILKLATSSLIPTLFTVLKQFFYA